MKIQRLHLEGYGRFDDLLIDFADMAFDKNPVTVIIGNNGAGKSQILQALSTGLSWLVEKTNDSERSADTEGRFIEKLMIKNSNYSATINLQIETDGYLRKNNEWLADSINIDINLSTSLYSTVNTDEEEVPAISYSGLNEFLNSTIYQLSTIKNASLPLIAIYPTERLLDFNGENEKKLFAYKQMEGYVDALNAGRNFNAFLDWLRNREDIENAELKKEVDTLMRSENANISKLSKRQDKQLQAIKNAIKTFLADFDDIWIDREAYPFTMKLSKQGETLNVNQLSQGEKSLLALVGDIARRLGILNPSLDNPLEGEGVVLVDEIDLHLHPKWQHDLIDKLVATFPNCQFILTTHSPHLISDRDDMLVYALNDGELTQVPNVYGEDVNTLLTQVFDVDVRDSKVEEQFNQIRRAISDQDFDNAQTDIDALVKQLPAQNVELLKCRLMLAQAKLDAKDG